MFNKNHHCITVTQELKVAVTKNILLFLPTTRQASELKENEVMEKKAITLLKAAQWSHSFLTGMHQHLQKHSRAVHTQETQSKGLDVTTPVSLHTAVLSPGTSQMVKKVSDYYPNKNNSHPFLTES